MTSRVGRQRPGRRVDAADQEPGLVHGGERGQPLPSGGEEHPPPERRAAARRRRQRVDLVPACRRSPAVHGGADQAEQRHPGRGARGGGVGRDALRANGCVASTTAATCWARSQSARPSAPPKPPIRTSPAGSAGSRTRPASEETDAQLRPSPASRPASSRASPVPPRISTVAAVTPVTAPPGHGVRGPAEQVAVHDPAVPLAGRRPRGRDLRAGLGGVRPAIRISSGVPT